MHRRSFLKKFHASNPPSHLVSGTKGEEMVHRLLLKRGYRILERNYRSKLGEIDIIAMDKEVLVFVEVKSRSNNLYGEPGDFVDKRKQQRIMMTAELFMKQHNLTDLQPRFDVAEVYWERGGIRYIQNGFPGF
ncbi:MAG: YraN family protein [Tissierellia bacterium]|nr:YraN family protein [Tissierellia bacterium]